MRRIQFLAFVVVGTAVLGCAGTSPAPVVPVARFPQGTTLEKSIGLVGAPNQGLKGSYSRLGHLPGWPLIVREELEQARPGREVRRKTLAAFVHLTDIHIIDGQSPARAPYLRKFNGMGGLDLVDAFRCQEQLSTYVAESMVQRVNSLQAAPITGAPLTFAVSTGDNGDGNQLNELQNYLNVLDGLLVTANSSGQGYVGCQDDAVFAPGDPNVSDSERNAIYGQYWHPNPVPAAWTGRIEPDMFKMDYGYPQYPGLLDAGSVNFVATGLRMPWYSGNGNHDVLIQGNFDLEGGTLEFMDLLAEGPMMIMDLPPSVSPAEFYQCVETTDVQCIEKIVTESPKREVPAAAARKIHSRQDFVQMHLASPPFPGPVGHGFSRDNLLSGKLYYTFPIAQGVLGIMLDTCNQAGGADGSLGMIQAEWLEQRLRENSSRYLDGAGRWVRTGKPDQLIVLFSHHNLLTMENLAPDPLDPVRLNPSEVKDLLHRYPNMILWVNGHSHVNRVWSHSDPRGRTAGFWEVNTASHIDFPQQSRTVEIVDNMDGTLSVFGILIDHMAPPATEANPRSPLALASVSRELSANDPLFSIPFQIGQPSDRNVELLVKKPF
ncbi:MAG TPA: TIGR03767 family metallophosphoesterase [Fimbriimonadaceae bacterium]|nr:TIGR03767 family metallophosphoesterase [Fimbriimonadaceae bacterium]HRJ97427.1 TIGR03767 family metallophosphoesterase [Fimbriimonadaceae bacterium]